MISKYAEYTSQLGTVIDEDETHNLGGGSTDMGNVSYEVPSIHPDFAIGSDCNTHTMEFTPAAGNLNRDKPINNPLFTASALCPLSIYHR